MDDEVVAQFTDITGATPQRAQQYLTLSDGNVEQAVQLFFESGGVDMGGHFHTPLAPNAAGHGGTGQAADDAIRIDSDDEDMGGRGTEDDEAIARRMQQEMYGGGGGGDGVDIDPETGVRRPMARTAETLAAPTPYGDDQEDLDDAVRAQLLARRRPNGSSRLGIFNQRPPPSNAVWEDEDEDPGLRRQRLARATGGASEATSKSTRLAEMYRPPFDIISPLVSWDGIRAQGKELEKWILLNVQDPNIFDCQLLNRDIWKHAEIKDTIRENFLFKQYTKDDPQAQTYVRYYFQNADSQDAYPHIAIVDPRTGEQVKVWSGPPVPSQVDFLSQLHEFLDRYSLKANARNPVANRKADKKKVDVEKMTEEEMLEMALQNSLNGGPSGPKPEDPDVLTRETRLITSPPTNDTSDSTTDAALPVQNGLSAFAQISSANPHEEPDISAANTTRIQFRHPTGRVVRRFLLSNPVRRVFEWLKASPVEGHEGQTFELVFMGKNLLAAIDSTIEAAGLKNGSVMVEFVED